MTETALEPRASDRRDGRLPLPALIALALSGFVTILTEALPAGLLPQIAADLSVSQSGVGQTVTVYALGSLIAAIPLTRATQGVRRRPLLAATMLGFAIANLVTAVSASYLLTLIARCIAGISAGLLWALLGGTRPGWFLITRRAAQLRSPWPERLLHYRSVFQPQRISDRSSDGGRVSP